jgi:hypothetical protein
VNAHLFLPSYWAASSNSHRGLSFGSVGGRERAALDARFDITTHTFGVNPTNNGLMPTLNSDNSRRTAYSMARAPSSTRKMLAIADHVQLPSRRAKGKYR